MTNHSPACKHRESYIVLNLATPGCDWRPGLKRDDEDQMHQQDGPDLICMLSCSGEDVWTGQRDSREQRQHKEAERVQACANRGESLRDNSQ